jgi:hypothetical protein
VNYFGYRDASNKMQLLINTPSLFELITQDAAPPSDLSAEAVAAMGADSDDDSDDFPCKLSVQFIQKKLTHLPIAIDTETVRLNDFLEQGKMPPTGIYFITITHS